MEAVITERKVPQYFVQLVAVQAPEKIAPESQSGKFPVKDVVARVKCKEVKDQRNAGNVVVQER